MGKDISSDKSLDVRGVACPMTWVKTKLMLEAMNPGEVLDVTLDSEDAIRDISKNAKSEGHKVIKLEKEDDHFILSIQRG